MASLYPSNNLSDEFEFDDNERDMDVGNDGSDEDTEEASETEQRKYEPRPQAVVRPADITKPDGNEVLYWDKRRSLEDSLKKLYDGTNPEYIRKCKRLKQQYTERLRQNNHRSEILKELADKDFLAEKRAALKDFEERSAELKEIILLDLEEKKKMYEAEMTALELAGDSAETKPTMTRKLRRRPNDPAPIPDKRRGKMNSLPSQISYQLDESDIDHDLKTVARMIKTAASARKSNGLQALGPVIPDTPMSEIKIEDGKLLYERKWYHRGQTIYVEGKEMPKFPATISAIGSEAISVKKTIDSTKVRINMNQLLRGKVIIKRRAP